MKTETQNRAIIKALKNGLTLSPLMALRMFGTMKLSSRITECTRILAKHQPSAKIIRKRMTVSKGCSVQTYRLVRK